MMHHGGCGALLDILLYKLTSVLIPVSTAVTDLGSDKLCGIMTFRIANPLGQVLHTGWGGISNIAGAGCCPILCQLPLLAALTASECVAALQTCTYAFVQHLYNTLGC